MRTEYMLTDAQKARIKQIDDQIFVLNMERAGIYAMARIVCVTEHDDNIDAIIQGNAWRYATFGEPIIKQDAIVELNFGGDDDDGRTEETGGGES